MANWEIVIRDGVLASMLRELMQDNSPWDQDAANFWYDGRHVVCTIADIENARLTSPMWRATIDSSPEWAALRLARWDYANEVDIPWLSYEQYEMNRMRQNWDLFGSTWRMATPIPSRRLRLSPVGSLTCPELDQLRNLLNVYENRRVEVEDGEILEADPELWIADHHRA